MAALVHHAVGSLLLAIALLAGTPAIAAGPGAADSRPAERPGPGDHRFSISVAGRERFYDMHVPASYRPGRPVPLVCFIHGLGGNAEMSRNGTRFDEASDASGFLMLYPEGTSSGPGAALTWNAGSCCGDAAASKIDDVLFFRMLFEDLRRRFDIDTEKLYATGFSNGGMMCHRLACEEPGLFAAIASVAGCMSVQACKPNRPTRVLHIHGSADDREPYEANPSRSGRPFAGARATAMRWVEVNGCAPEPEARTLTARVESQLFRPSGGGPEVQLVTLQGARHFWPSTSDATRKKVAPAKFIDFDATDFICRFFGVR